MKFEIGRMGGVPAYWCRYSFLIPDSNYNDFSQTRKEGCIHASTAEIRHWAKRSESGRLPDLLVRDFFISRVSKIEKVPLRVLRAIVLDVPAPASG